MSSHSHETAADTATAAAEPGATPARTKEPMPAPAATAAPIRPRDRSFYTWLLVITLLGLAWRVAYVLIWRRDMVVWGDPYFYHRGGVLLAEGRGWINPFIWDLRGTVYEAADHPPVYLLYLAGVTKVFGQSVLTHLLASTVIGAGSVYLAGLAGRQVAGKRIGLIAAVIAAVYPNMWNWDGLLLSETTAIFAVLLVIWLAYRFWRTPTLWGGAWLGAAIGFAVLTRAEVLLLSVFVVVPLVLARRIGSWKRRLGWLTMSGAACVAVLTPWVAHNLSRYDQPVLLSNGFEITLATSTCDETFYTERIGWWSLECSLGYLEENGVDEALISQDERAQILRRETLEYLGDNLDRLPVVVLARWGRATGLYKPWQQADFDILNERMTPWVPRAGAVALYPIAIFAVAGGVILRRRRIPILPLVAPLITVAIVVTMFFGQARYRASAEGALVVLAAVGADAAYRWFRARRGDHEEPVPPDDDEVAEPVPV